MAKLAGIDLLLLPTEHRYSVTEAIPQIAAMDRRSGVGAALQDRGSGTAVQRALGDRARVRRRTRGQPGADGLADRKGHAPWSREYSPEYWPQEVGRDPLCKMDKDFLNKDAVAKTLQNAARERMVILAINAEDTDASNADATGGEPIFRDGQGIGRVTSGAYGYSLGMSLAQGFVRDMAPGDAIEVMILGRSHRARSLAEPPINPPGHPPARLTFNLRRIELTFASPSVLHVKNAPVGQGRKGTRKRCAPNRRRTNQTVWKSWDPTASWTAPKNKALTRLRRLRRAFAIRRSR